MTECEIPSSYESLDRILYGILGIDCLAEEFASHSPQLHRRDILDHRQIHELCLCLSVTSSTSIFSYIRIRIRTHNGTEVFTLAVEHCPNIRRTSNSDVNLIVQYLFRLKVSTMEL